MANAPRTDSRMRSPGMPGGRPAVGRRAGSETRAQRRRAEGGVRDLRPTEVGGRGGRAEGGSRWQRRRAEGGVRDRRPTEVAGKARRETCGRAEGGVRDPRPTVTGGGRGQRPAPNGDGRRAGSETRAQRRRAVGGVRDPRPTEEEDPRPTEEGDLRPTDYRECQDAAASKVVSSRVRPDLYNGSLPPDARTRDLI